MNTELKPCPFCGAAPKLSSFPAWNNKEEHCIECVNPSCLIMPKSLLIEGMAHAISAWNTRVDRHRYDSRFVANFVQDSPRPKV